MSDQKEYNGIKLLKVTSTNVVRIGWEREPKRRLLVLFKNGALYEYDDVEQRHYVLLTHNTASVGKYLFKYIIPRYRSRKLENVITDVPPELR